jgi:hypothetical protein
VARNAWTMPQERYNTEWIEEKGVGLVLESFRDVRPAVRELTARLGEFRARIAGIQNRAVFEIPRILQQILESRLSMASGVGVDFLEHFRAAQRLHLT